MKGRELHNLGVPRGAALSTALEAAKAAGRAGWKRLAIRTAIEATLASPEERLEDPIFGLLAVALTSAQRDRATFRPRSAPAPYRQWGEGLEPQSIQQMINACALPVAVAGALMPDAHVGYGLPIGGVLATDNAVIPYAVGVDIACRMKLTVLDLPPALLSGEGARLEKVIERETCFGVGGSFKARREHEVMDRDWSVSPITRQSRDKAWAQLGTSGSGNHFVELGELTVLGEARADLGIEPGTYLALLSHSGSRGTGAAVADHYSRLAMAAHPELPKELKHLAWLDLDDHDGAEYWAAMELMGHYAAANHAVIHRQMARALGAEVLLDVENHHNFAWKEVHGGRKLVVHRKGATPAGRGVLGVIPGTMADPAYLVRGLGHPDSLDSASHGAGRRMSRKAALSSFTWHDTKKLLAERGVKLLSAGLDEAPMAYKDINTVMAAQADLVEPIGRFRPRLVKMAPAGERPED